MRLTVVKRAVKFSSGLLRHGDTSSELNAISRFKAMEGLNPQVKRKILSDNPRRLYGI
jgi:predicted TIM-barrel fold metal-dependent hydrolase